MKLFKASKVSRDGTITPLTPAEIAELPKMPPQGVDTTHFSEPTTFKAVFTVKTVAAELRDILPRL